jgi:Raf kinase inhibitor-like YbhB/YbcL family protein
MPEFSRPDPYQFLAQVPSFTLTSDDLEPGKTMPQAQVFNGWGQAGENLSPHLRWEDAPAGTKSFAVTCYDPDAPTESGFWHWLLFDIPASVTELPRAVGSPDMTGLPPGAIHARNDFGAKAYGGAAPPAGGGPHRYFFVVHALGVESLGLDSEAAPAVVGFTCNANVVGRATLVVQYEAV